MLTSQQYRLIRAMAAHGEPVQKTTSGFELGGGTYLCRMKDMSELKTLGLVEKLGDTHFGLTEAGRTVAARKEIWELTREEYFNDMPRVRDDVSVDKKGYRIQYEYTDPHPAGPFRGVVIADNDDLKIGSVYLAPFGAARITSASRMKVIASKMDLMDVFEAAKDLYKHSVFNAVEAGLPVREEVIAQYPDIMAILNMQQEDEAEAPAP